MDPSPIESGGGVSTPVTEATPETEQIQHLDHGTEASTNALPQVKPEVFQATESINLAPQQSTPATPSSQSGSIGDKGQPLCRTPDSHETRSSAMKAAWARRKAQGRNGRDGGTPKHSTVVSHSLMGSSPVTFAAQILAAAEEAQKNASPTLTPTPQDCESLPSPSPSQATPERFAGATSWTQSPGTTAYSRLGKKHGPYKKRNVSGLAATRAYSPSSQLHSPSLSGPSSPYGYPNHGYMPRGESVDSEARPSKNRQSVCGKCGKDHMKHQPICDIGLPGTDSESDDSLAGTSNIRQYVCEGCGKVYQQFAGLKYHKEHHPKCEAEPPRAGKRTDLAGMTESRRV